MEGHFSNHFELEDREKGVGSQFSGVIKDGKVGIKRKRSVQKRVVSVRISDVEGSRGKGEGAPPSDSWAWRKYGQKPIKGSPYPRGYYRCSSFKGCPARKQVERSSVDPTMLVITYACEHNHSSPVQKSPITSPGPKLPSEGPTAFVNPLEFEPGDEFADLGGADSLTTDDLYWFSDVAPSSPSMENVLHSPICGGEVVVADEFGAEDSLFADLGELPECSVVFRRGCFEKRCSLRAAAQVVDNVRHPISSYDEMS